MASAASPGVLCGRRSVQRGDRVVIYMPMVPEAAIAMLACARLGRSTRWCSVGSRPPELAARIDATSPRALIAASPARWSRAGWWSTSRCWTRRIALAQHRPEACFVLQRPQAHATLLAGRGPRPVGRPRRPCEPARSGACRGDRSALHPLHLRHDGPAEGHCPRQRRSRRRARCGASRHLRASTR